MEGTVFRTIFIIVAVIFSQITLASTDPFAQQKEMLYVEVQLTAEVHENSDTLLGKVIYVEKTINDEKGTSVYAVMYSDEEFTSAYVGFAKKFGELQVGIGAGPAREDGKTSFAINPWVYYSKDGITGQLTIERYFKKSDKWWGKAYIYKDINEVLYAGLQCQSGVGIGPIIGAHINEKASVWAFIPLVEKPSEGGVSIIFGALIKF